MSLFTQFFNLDKYEGSDRPNLRDQYNSAMDKIDAALHSHAGSIAQSATSIATLQSSVAQHTTQIATATSDAAAARSEAATALSTATAAAAAIGGSSFEFISNGDKGTKWTALGDSYVDQSSIRFDAVIVTNETSGESLMISHVGCDWSSSTAVTALGHQILRLRDWRFVMVGDEDTYEAWGYLDFIQAARFLFQASPQDTSVIQLNAIREVAAGTGGLSGTIICQVAPRV